jgi:NADH-quinone oxidoreductase subunit A
MSPTLIVAYLTLFTAAGVLFVFGSLLLGRFLRPKSPTAVKREIYECGEPAVGSSFVQFDLRFYVVALLFIIFDVEMAFFFPWATVFGKATQLMDPNLRVVVDSKGVVDLSAAAQQEFRELGVPEPAVPLPGRSLIENQQQVREEAGQLALTAMVDIGVFFAVLLVGFAYVWYRGDLDWVRAVTREPAEA